MTYALWLKEWRAHRIVVVILWLFALLFFASSLFRFRNQGSPLQAFQVVVIFSGIIFPFAIINRLVVSEYRGQTQHFLETLPVSRFAVVLSKWLIGLLLILIPLAICLVIAYYKAHSRAVITASQLNWMLLRCGSFIIFAYALCFAIALTGRFRFVVWVVLLLSAVFVNEWAQISLDRWAPMHLVMTDNVVYPHNTLPFSEIAITWLLIVALIVVSLLLSLSREGSIITGLYSRMSHNEKVVMAVLGVVVLSAITQIDERRPKPPFQLQQAAHSDGEMPNVAVQINTSMDDQQAAILSNQLAQTLKELQNYLDLSVLPVVSIIPDSSLDSDVFMLASTKSNDGVVVRTAIDDSNLHRVRLNSFVIRQVFEWYANGQGISEERQWLLDGFIQWWLNQDAQQQHLLSLRAVVAQRQYPLQRQTLDHWLTAREQLGDCVGDALAWRVVAYLASDLNSAKFRKLMRQLFSERPASDARYWIQKPNMQSALKEAGISLDAVVSKVTQQLVMERLSYSKEINDIPPRTVQFVASPMRGRNREIKYQVDSDKDQIFSIRYVTINPWQGALDLNEISRVDAAESGVLPLTVQRGALLFTALEKWDDTLQCKVRSGAVRWEVK